LKDQLENLREREGPVAADKNALTPAEHAQMDSLAGRAIVAAIKQHKPDIESIHPEMNLEIDLGLDSLARAECVASTEQTLKIVLKPEELAAVQTVEELLNLSNTKLSGPREELGGTPGDTQFHWHDVVKNDQARLQELEPILKQKTLISLFAFASLSLINFAARLFFRMEVKGSEILVRLKPPYLICPNHQSYLDPFLLCSTYPGGVLKNIFHVGASMYFTNRIMAQLARLINVVPIDPDAQLLRSIRAGAAGLRAGKILNIYPEGQRSFDGQLLEFKKGAAILASELAVPIVPVAIDGTYRTWPRNRWRLRFAKVKLRFGDAIDPKDVAAGERKEEVVYERVTAVLKARIQEMLDDMRE
jgi:long-chain acyl-CoA synthetase